MRMWLKCPYCKINSEFEVFSEGPLSRPLGMIIEERVRQTLPAPEGEGHTPAHDDEHIEGQLALLAAAYALSSRGGRLTEWGLAVHLGAVLEEIGWQFKPAITDPIRDLTRAGALIMAELERRLRNQDPVSRAIAEGKLREGQRGWAKEFFDRDPAGFGSYVEKIAPEP